MSRIDDLIAQHCPDGVEYKRLESIVSPVPGKRGLKRSEYLSEGAFPIVDQGQGAIAGRTDDASLLLGEPPHIVFGDHTRAVKWVDFPFAVGAQGTKVLKVDESLDPKYVFYAFENFELQDRGYSRHWTFAKEAVVPIPPPAVQQEIVSILDAFTELESGLETELRARRGQYAHYKETLIQNEEEERPNFVSLSEVAAFSPRRVNALGLAPTNFVGVDNLIADLGGRRDASYPPNTKTVTAFQSGDVLLGNIRPYLKKAWLADREGGCSGDVLAVAIKRAAQESLDPRFLYHALTTESFFSYNMRHSRGAKMPRGDKQAIMRFKIPLPPLEKQREIADILDKFEALVNDTSVGLPAEIEARRKQYEYYRDKLLSFPEKKAATESGVEASG